jgi:hypothetical protein
MWDQAQQGLHRQKVYLDKVVEVVVEALMIMATAALVRRAAVVLRVEVVVSVVLAAHFLVSKRVAVTVELVEQEAHLVAVEEVVQEQLLLIKQLRGLEEWVVQVLQVALTVLRFGD